MTRIKILAALVAIACLSLSVAAYQQAGRGQAQARVVDVDKLRDNLYVLRGGGGNTAIFIAANGVVVVDTKNPGWGQPILEKIKTLTDKPVTTIINTHTHGDHVSGNVEFPATVDIIVQENTKTNMEKMGAVTGIATTPAPNIFKEHNGVGMPKHTFKDKMTLGKGADEIDLYYFGRGHTNGDAFVVFPSLHVMHAGDVFARKGPVLLDANNGGSGVAVGDTLAKAHAGIKNVDQIITGHSTVMTWADLEEYSEFNKEFLTWVQRQKAAGKSVDAAAAEYTIPERYKGYTPNPTQTKTNIQVIYNELAK